MEVKAKSPQLRPSRTRHTFLHPFLKLTSKSMICHHSLPSSLPPFIPPFLRPSLFISLHFSTPPCLPTSLPLPTNVQPLLLIALESLSFVMMNCFYDLFMHYYYYGYMHIIFHFIVYNSYKLFYCTLLYNILYLLINCFTVLSCTTHCIY